MAGRAQAPPAVPRSCRALGRSRAAATGCRPGPQRRGGHRTGAHATVVGSTGSFPPPAGPGRDGQTSTSTMAPVLAHVTEHCHLLLTGHGRHPSAWHCSGHRTPTHGAGNAPTVHYPPPGGTPSSSAGRYLAASSPTPPLARCHLLLTGQGRHPSAWQGDGPWRPEFGAGSAPSLIPVATRARRSARSARVGPLARPASAGTRTHRRLLLTRTGTSPLGVAVRRAGGA